MNMRAKLRVVGDEERTAPLESPGPLTFDQLFIRYSSYVAAIGLRILGRSDEVDDLVQDVFLDAHRGLAALEKPAAVKGWLATVTVRKARRRLKKRRFKSFLHLDSESNYEQLADPGASPETLALISRVYRGLDALPTDERLAWTLRHVQGEKLKNVAALCGCSVATANRRIAAAGKRLREVMGDE